MEIPNTFIEYAVSILGDTNYGLTGGEIANLSSAYAFDFNVDIPFASYPFPPSLPNKRTALRENIKKFSSTQQFKIIKELCEHNRLKGNPNVEDLRIKLITRYGNLSASPDAINEILLEETKHWLSNYQIPLNQYQSALTKFNNGIFQRNLLDDLRLSLELLLKEIFGNSKSLENQISEIGEFIKSKNGSKEFANMFQKLIEYFSKYQNTYIKHRDNVIEQEVEFIFEITSSFMKHLVRLHKGI